MSNAGEEQPNRLHILIVEDNPTAATVQKMLMVRFNCEVDMAVTGEEAVDLAKKIHYDLILMDLGLPGIDGIQACQAIRKYEQDTHKNTVPMVAVTANADPQQHLLCEQAGMNDVITKPLTPDKAQHILSILKNNS
jgi:two-component system, sensor histidine kinase